MEQKTTGQNDLFGGAERRIPVTDPEIRRQMGAVIGLRMALNTLDDAQWAAQLAGMSIARTLIEREAATQQAILLRRTIRLCAKAGVDLTKWAVHAWDGDAIVVRPFVEDLAGAERAAAEQAADDAAG